jgi:hypothetical protein
MSNRLDAEQRRGSPPSTQCAIGETDLAVGDVAARPVTPDRAMDLKLRLRVPTMMLAL